MASINDPINYYQQEVEERAARIDEASSTLIYIGYTLATNPSQGDAIWKIKRISQSSTVWSIQFADGNMLYDNVWNNRSSLTYM